MFKLKLNIEEKGAIDEDIFKIYYCVTLEDSLMLFLTLVEDIIDTIASYQTDGMLTVTYKNGSKFT